MIINYDVSAILAQLANIDFAHVQNVTTPGTHLDDYTTGGIYYFSTANEPAGKPEGTSSFGFLIVINGGNNARLVQFWINSGTTTNTMWMRSSSSTSLSWGDWKRFMTSTDFAAERIYPTVVTGESIPSGITSIDAVTVVRTHNVVTVHLSLTRDSTSISSYQLIATGLPAPFLRPLSGSTTIPFGQIPVSGTQTGRPLSCSVNTSGGLIVARGETSGQYIGSFTYITNDY